MNYNNVLLLFFFVAIYPYALFGALQHLNIFDNDPQTHTHIRIKSYCTCSLTLPQSEALIFGATPATGIVPLPAQFFGKRVACSSLCLSLPN